MTPSPKKSVNKGSEEELLNASEGSAVSSTEELEDVQTLKKKPLKTSPLKERKANGVSDDKPMSEKRECKKVINFVVASPASVPRKLDLDQGSGVPLDDSPYINHMINMAKSDDLKFFHKILFLRPGSGLEIKKNIRKFKGYDFSKDDEKFQDLKGRIDRLKSRAVLVVALNIVGQNVGGNREELVERLASFLVSPTLVQRGIPNKRSGKKRVSKKKTKKNASSTKAKDVKRKKTVNKKETSEPSASESESPGEESTSEAEVETENPMKRKRLEQGSSDDEHSEPKGKNKTPAKRRKVLSKVNNNSVSKINKPDDKKSKKTQPAKKRQVEEESDDSDEELLIKKVKPSDKDIESFIKTYMKSVNLEEVTMKNMYQKVNDKYPNVDLASKKVFIRSTVKQILTSMEDAGDPTVLEPHH